MTGLDNQFSGRILKPADGMATLTVTGDAQAVDALSAADISVTADAGTVASAGDHILGVSVQVPAGIQYEVNLKEVTVKIEQA